MPKRNIEADITTVAIKMSRNYFEAAFKIAQEDSRSLPDYFRLLIEDKNPELRDIRKKEVLQKAGIID